MNVIGCHQQTSTNIGEFVRIFTLLTHVNTIFQYFQHKWFSHLWGECPIERTPLEPCTSALVSCKSYSQSRNNCPSEMH